jgi:hypothetical protein
MLLSIHQRIVDWRRERRIRALRVQANTAYEAGDMAAMRRIGMQVFAECALRSPQQRLRMTLERDPHEEGGFQA